MAFLEESGVVRLWQHILSKISTSANDTLEQATKYTDDALTNKITYGTDEPFGGSNGDIYIQIIE